MVPMDSLGRWGNGFRSVGWFPIDLTASRATHARVPSDLLRCSRRKPFGHISEPSDLIDHLIAQRVIDDSDGHLLRYRRGYNDPIR
jgi:hypothetical protein